MNRTAVGMFIVRLLVGFVFFIHGVQKIWWNFAGHGLNGYMQWAHDHGFNTFCAYYGAFGELIPGLFLMLGIISEGAALLTIPIMYVATFNVLWPHGYFAQYGGYEYTLNLIILAAAIIIGGPGAYAIWDPFKKN